MQAVLRSNDLAQQTLALNLEENNPQAIDDLRNYIELCDLKHHSIIIHDMIEKRYSLRPYGWPDLEVILLLCRLIALGEVSLRMEGDTLPLDKIFENIKTPSKWRKITIHKRKTSDPETLQKARKLGQDVFSEMGPDNEDALCAFLKEKLIIWEAALNRFKPLADTGNYPGGEEISDGLNIIRPLLNSDESYKLIERMNQQKDNLLDLSDEFHNLEQFYDHQKPTWDKLRSAYNRFKLNSLDLDQNEEAAQALQRMQEIQTTKAPYGIIHESEGLISRVDLVNKDLLNQSTNGICPGYGPPTDSGEALPAPWGAGPFTGDLWYSFVLPPGTVNADLTFSAGGLAYGAQGGTDFNLTVYSGNCAALVNEGSGIPPFAGAGGTSLPNLIFSNAGPGADTYYIRVVSLSGTPEGQFTVSISRNA